MTDILAVGRVVRIGEGSSAFPQRIGRVIGHAVVAQANAPERTQLMYLVRLFRGHDFWSQDMKTFVTIVCVNADQATEG